MSNTAEFPTSSRLLIHGLIYGVYSRSIPTPRTAKLRRLVAFFTLRGYTIVEKKFGYSNRRVLEVWQGEHFQYGRQLRPGNAEAQRSYILARAADELGLFG